MTPRPAWLEQALHNEIEEYIRTDGRTTRDTFLGWPRGEIFRDVIDGGQADFDAPLKQLTGLDRAVLYAKYNQARHLDELGHAFERLFAVQLHAGKPIIIDIGCGPFTAGLALAAVLGPDVEFHYLGVDRSDAMRDLGTRLASAAFSNGGLHRSSICHFHKNLTEVDFGQVRDRLTIIVASYLFASPTLDAAELATTVLDTLKKIGPGPAAVLYTNSAAPGANVKYPAFQEALLSSGFQTVVDKIERFTGTKTPKDMRYSLLFRPAAMTIPIRKPTL
jgi:hypothetical protein